MKIITGVCNGKRYKLSLTSARLTQLSRPQTGVDQKLFVMLRDFNLRTDGGARLRSKSRPGDLNDPYTYNFWIIAGFDDASRRIGCTTFSKRAWKQIKAAIAAAK